MAKASKPKNNILIGPVILVIGLTILIMIVSSILSTIGLEGQKTAIVGGTLETSLITIKNIFSFEGIRYFFGNTVVNFRLFEPLVLLIIALIGIGIGEKSGLLTAIFRPLKRLKPGVLTFLIVLIGMMSTVIGNYSYIFLLPLVGVIYQKIGRNPMLGILTVFLGITLGYGTGFIYNYDNDILGALTQASAAVDVDKNYIYNVLSSLYIMTAMTFILSFMTSVLIEKFLAPKMKRIETLEEEVPTSKKGMIAAFLAFIVCTGVIIYMIVPGMKGSGVLLDQSAPRYMLKLLGDKAPFHDAFIYLFSLVLMITSYIYGRISHNIKNNHEYTVDLSSAFTNLGYLFVLMFFTSTMIGVLEWTNLGEVIATRLIDFMSVLQFSGIPLIMMMFIVVILMSILVPSSMSKWALASPLLIPLFMRSNITPEFTQFIFQMADGIGKCLTPLFIYFMIMIGFLQKYSGGEEKVTVFGTLKKCLPIILSVAGIALFIILIWYIAGLPMGIGSFPTL